jgi:alpha-D-ribose 1-methylphosphonate 5-triphosphate synthase subunit PhnH
VRHLRGGIVWQQTTPPQLPTNCWRFAASPDAYPQKLDLIAKRSGDPVQLPRIGR